MKTTLLITLLAGVLASAQAQDFRAVPPAEQPNAGELAYFSGRHPNFQAADVPDSTNVWLVLDFLNNLKSGQLEATHRQLSENFEADGPGFADFLKADDFLQQWDRYGRTFADQRFDIETARSMKVADGARQGTWVYVRGVWSGNDSRRGRLRIRVPFHTLARLSGGLIERTYTSYGNDQLFYDLGFPLYASPSSVVQRR